MKPLTNLNFRAVLIPVLLVFISPVSLAQQEPSACVEFGALAYDNWTKSDSGGSGLPAGEADNDYVRCKACHGWDRLGTEGGYVRRSRNSGRPNAGAGDSDQSSRVISPFMGGHDPITAEMIRHAGIGRSWEDGTGSWVPLQGGHSAANKAAHAQGYTLGNQHPDLSADGANMGDVVPTMSQIDCLVEFLNYADADPSAYFSSIDPSQDPVLYTIVDGADAAAGEIYYNDSCFGCHGDPATDHQGLNGGVPEGGILAYLAEDGKFSEFAHKARWGIPDEIMTRETLNSPTSDDIANLMLWLQELGGTGFAMNAGLNGNWWNGPERNGEGFQVELVRNNPGELTLVATFYTYDVMGNQVFLVAVGSANGNSAEVDVFITDGGMYGQGLGDLGFEEQWGTGTFTASGCGSMQMALMPNPQYEAQGFTDLMYDLHRLASSAAVCPSVPGPGMMNHSR